FGVFLLLRSKQGGALLSALARDVQAVGAFLQRLAIRDGDSAALREDQPASLQLMQRDRYTGTLRAQHDGEELVRQRQVVAAEAIPGHQQPSRQALLDLVQSI